jgi:sulfatase maturation enzyme AslB (radical SAM superfamily)
VRLRSLTLVVTDDCNFDCLYCFKKKARRSMPLSIAEGAVSAFLPYFGRAFNLNFYGGEPLLEFDLIRDAVGFALSAGRPSGRRPRFSLTTNGSLCTDDVLSFLELHRFSAVLSYDGSAQDGQRAPESRKRTRALIRRIVDGRRIGLEVNGVFRPETVGALFETVGELDALGVENIRASLSTLRPWREAETRRLGAEWKKIRAWAGRVAGRRGFQPVANLREEEPPRVRFCPAGRDRMAVDTGGRVWGCALFSDWAKKTGSPAARRFSFGTVRSFRAAPGRNYARIIPRYEVLSRDRCRTDAGPCFLCPDIGRCGVCPVNAALSGGAPAFIPLSLCRLQKAKRRDP